MMPIDPKKGRVFISAILSKYSNSYIKRSPKCVCVCVCRRSKSITVCNIKGEEKTAVPNPAKGNKFNFPSYVRNVENGRKENDENSDIKKPINESINLFCNVSIFSLFHSIVKQKNNMMYY